MPKIIVFPSNRKVRKYYLDAKDGIIFDKIICVDDFFSKLIYERSFKRKASEYESSVLMHLACEKTYKSKELKINENFFAFLKNKEYLFSFFKELSLERKSIADIACKDYYAQYEEHLEILDELLKNYLSLLDEKKLYDDISLPLSYDLDYDFISSYDEIFFELAGFLSKFELETLSKLSSKIKVVINFYVSKFNIAYLKEVSFLKDLDLKLYHSYDFEISNKLLLEQKKDDLKREKIHYKAFEFKSLQANFVFDELSKYVRMGIDPKDIVVISPDESFCEFLRLYDSKNLLNYASGKSIKESLFYRRIKLLRQALEADFIYDEDEKYFQNQKKVFDLYNSSLKYLNLNSFTKIKEKSKEKFSYDFFKSLISSFLQDESIELQNLIEDELCLISTFLKDENFKNLSFKQILDLFLGKISNINLSVLGGSDVTVMGLLESRAMQYEAVIVLDFNDDFIPKRNVNELFLNNEIRNKSGLISYERRENLQRFYYESLFRKAKYISISFVENEERIRSRFLDELDFDLKAIQKPSKAYLAAFKQYEAFKMDLNPLKAPVLKHNPFEKPISFSRLSLFLQQKRTYYYKYIEKIKEARALDISLLKTNFGDFIHQMLKIYYTKNEVFILDDFISLLEENIKFFSICKLELELFKIRLTEFALNEKERLKKGYKTLFVEKELEKSIFIEENSKKYEIKLTGILDRVDMIDDEAVIIDYKSSKIPKDSYQLAFYKLLYNEKAQAFYYDLRDKMTLVSGENTKSLEDLKDCFKQMLKDIDKELIFENEGIFSKYCPYKSIYEKNLK